jgi:hypothetical protein
MTTPEIFLHDTSTRTKRRFEPLDRRRVRMYACGPTVYDRIHIGNGRMFVVFDTLYRLLRAVYPKVIYVRNITDVDDKINARAAERNIPIAELTAETERLFHEDVAALGVLEPDVEPRAMCCSTFRPCPNTANFPASIATHSLQVPGSRLHPIRPTRPISCFGSRQPKTFPAGTVHGGMAVPVGISNAPR